MRKNIQIRVIDRRHSRGINIPNKPFPLLKILMPKEPAGFAKPAGSFDRP